MSTTLHENTLHNTEIIRTSRNKGKGTRLNIRVDSAMICLENPEQVAALVETMSHWAYEEKRARSELPDV